MMYTPGGSPIFFNSPKNSFSKGKTLYSCSADRRHRLTKNQAKNSGYNCTHCGAPLRVQQQKLRELASLMNSFK